jgi:hypothetical protein
LHENQGFGVELQLETPDGTAERLKVTGWEKKTGHGKYGLDFLDAQKH